MQKSKGHGTVQSFLEGHKKMHSDLDFPQVSVMIGTVRAEICVARRNTS